MASKSKIQKEPIGAAGRWEGWSPKFKISNRDKGYTLIEILVAVSIFVALIAAPTGFFVSSLTNQQKALFSQGLIDNVSYNLEYISRAIRMAKKDLDGKCIQKNMNYKITRQGQGIEFRNYEDQCQEFFWDTADNRLKEKKQTTVLPLTSNDLEVLNFKIGPQDSWGQNDDLQPRVAVYLEIKSKKSAKPELQPKIKIQTTISQRNLDVTQ